MPRFRFQTLDAVHGHEDDSCELPDVAAARRTATVYMSDVLREIGPAIYDEDLRVTVTDEAGELCWDVTISGIEGPGAARA